MSQPKKPPLSLRIPEETRVRVEKWATEQGVPRNAAYVQLIEQGLKANGPHPGLNERPLATKSEGPVQSPPPPAPFRGRTALGEELPVKAFAPNFKKGKAK